MDQKTLQKILITLIILTGTVAIGSSLHLPFRRGNAKCRCIRGTGECHMEVIELSMAAAYSKGIPSCMPGSRLCCNGDVTGTSSENVVADTDGTLMMKMPPNYKQRRQQTDPKEMQAEDARIPEKEETENKTVNEIGAANTSEGESSTVYPTMTTTPQDQDSIDTGHLMEESDYMMMAYVKESVPSVERINLINADHDMRSEGDAEFAEDNEILVPSPDTSERLYDSTTDGFTLHVPQGTTESTTEGIVEHSQRPKLIPGSLEADETSQDVNGSQEVLEGSVGVGNITSEHHRDEESVTETSLLQEESTQSLVPSPTSKLSENEVIDETRNEIEISTLSENVLPTPPTYTTASLKDTIDEPETGQFHLDVTPSLLDEDFSSSPMSEPWAGVVHVTEASVPLAGVEKQEADRERGQTYSESVTSPGGEPLDDSMGNTVLCSRLSCGIGAELAFGVPSGPSGHSERPAVSEGSVAGDSDLSGEGVTELAPPISKHVTGRPVTHRTLPPLHLNSEEELKAFLKSLENLPKGGTSTDVTLAVKNRNQGRNDTFLSWLWG